MKTKRKSTVRVIYHNFTQINNHNNSIQIKFKIGLAKTFNQSQIFKDMKKIKI